MVSPSLARMVERLIVVSTTEMTVGMLEFLFDELNAWPQLNSLAVVHLRAPKLDLGVFSKLPQLRVLSLANSSIADLHTHPNVAERLVELDLSSNAIATFDDLFFHDMTRLDTLNLAHNWLSGIFTGDLTPLRSLRSLTLTNNVISRISKDAFASMTGLRELVLDRNDLTVFEHAYFSDLVNLEKLSVNRNPLRELSSNSFTGLANLREIELEQCALTTVPAGIFSTNTNLHIVNMTDNFLKSLPPKLFEGLNQLTTVDLGDNALPSLPSGIFHELTELVELFLHDNRLTHIPSDLFASNHKLEAVTLLRNQLYTLPDDLFTAAAKQSMTALFVGDNHLTTIDRLVDGMVALKVLFANNNQLTAYQGNTPKLEVLDLSFNPLQHMPNLMAYPNLQRVRMQEHRISQIDFTPLLQLRHLHTLVVTAANDVDTLATVDRQALNRNTTEATATSPIRVLSVHNIDMSAMFRDKQAPTQPGFPRRMELSSFELGWPGMDEHTVPMHVLCDMLADDASEFGIRRTGLTMIDVEHCTTANLGSFFFQENSRLQVVRAGNKPLLQLNVSDCPQLTTIDAAIVDILDVSRTLLPPLGTLCETLGAQMLFAREMKHPDFAAGPGVQRLLQQCLKNNDVVEFSGNRWINDRATIDAITQDIVVLSDASRTYGLSDYSEVLTSRTTPPLLQLAKVPVQCRVQLENTRLRHVDNSDVVLSRPTYRFRCTCAQGFKMEDGRCVVNAPNVAAIAVGSVIGGLAFGLLVTWLSRRYRGLSKRIGMHQQLLAEREEEVIALKQAWEIEFDELRMIKRVAAGAFGVVFKAEWDTVTVAVKVMQESLMLLDDTMVVEFEKEVEFLQKTRHPHVVRFFGAGTDPNGSPFLVLEFVAMGSLKDLLGKDMAQVLREVRERRTEHEAHEEVLTEDVGETITLVSTPGTGSGAGTSRVATAWDLKLRLLRDVASGMAFIHSLDQMHRDLKSGNVLVSANLRAKITDFGSIRQCFTRGRGGGKMKQTRLVSPKGSNSDPQYSQRTGLQTMTSMTLTAGVGTPLYMAPEALLGDKYSFEADVFSFGVLMWEVATQRPPDLIAQEKGSGYRGPILATLQELLGDGKRLTFTDDDVAAAGIPMWFRTLARTCMSQEPASRPTFEELKTNKDLAR
ncbi:TKL protein kinase [Salpingoeca rosetta]|uniref:TKL protein kinase n=1 Tax=Salpingoeca rosetta (strain ATCC 50818 / BSB-021) TaxID=946362 RepID=F2UAD0_SALR5|nr:TKL protein kinase [Salpingoeca rosetta]EGD73705.1 TKL protein kinase [Salpingoeca rosetta]|eukprot:XP_004993986.1 TKL protein kinase [Salpingoeca rosetta]